MKAKEAREGCDKAKELYRMLLPKEIKGALDPLCESYFLAGQKQMLEEIDARSEKWFKSKSKVKK